MKILVISMAGNGDTLFATPLIHELRAHFPDATIDALVRWRGAKGLLEGNPHLNSIHQRNFISDSKIGSLKFLLKLRAQGYDISFNTHPQSRRYYRLVAKFINAPMRLGHDYECSGALDRWLTNRTLPQDYTRHSAENNLSLLSLIKAKPLLPRHRYEVFLTDAEHAWAADFVTEQNLSGRPMLGVHVGSGGTKNLALRRWPLGHYLELVRRLRERHSKLAILFFGGPEEQADHEKIQTAAGGENLFFPKTRNLRQAAALLEKCGAFLSVDTALMHLATAMNVPAQVVIETPTWNKPIEPYGRPFVLVKNPVVAGRNLEFYRYDGRGIRGSDEELRRCMESVTVESVFDEINKFF
ncbi:MAG: glycosyltransferase family 9 protein [Limisphaerales bacterium]